jgi:alpha-beta hydrolase superfamily lysophospholipase
MAFKNYELTTSDNKQLVCYKWDIENPKAIVQIAHGMSEYSARYEAFAQFLNSNGIAVFAEDHRGHGKTAGSIGRVGHVADEDGMTKIMEDVVLLYKDIKKKYSKIPVFILGHSMGSFISRMLAYSYPEIYDGFIFSATSAHPGLKGTVGVKLAALIKSFGKRNRSKLFDSIAFGDFNKKYKPNRTQKDWLSRDEKVVDDYIKDKYCMQIFSAQFFYDLASVSIDINEDTNITNSDLTKPILFISGDMDPVGEYGKGITKVVNKFKELGASDVSFSLYEGGRHEMLQETNKSEVYKDVLTWILAKIK